MLFSFFMLYSSLFLYDILLFMLRYTLVYDTSKYTIIYVIQRRNWSAACGGVVGRIVTGCCFAYRVLQQLLFINSKFARCFVLFVLLCFDLLYFVLFRFVFLFLFCFVQIRCDDCSY